MPKKYELLIAEKPTSAKKIAEALADTKPTEKQNDNVPYYELTHNKKKIIIASALGHLYGLKEKEKNGWKYPTFSYEWKPLYETQKRAKDTKKFITTLKKLAKDADEFTVCTDFDDEGSVLGMNAAQYACNQKDAFRMKFSTLTKTDLVESYEHKMPHMDWEQVRAGITRHELDWIYGINNSRALTLAIKAAGAFKILSTGRVQGPALKIIVDKDREITVFKPVPYWELELEGFKEKEKITALHKEGKIFEKEKAQTILKKTQGKPAVVAEVKKRELVDAPPYPFDLTTLQTEADRCFGISPKETMSITQGLYLNGYISYPRSSSNKLPPALNYKKIITNLGKQPNYSQLADQLLQKIKLLPNEGPKTDPAHPAIHATGEIPKKLTERDRKIYDLIVRRTLATFADSATNEFMSVIFDVNKELFIAKGQVNLVQGWYIFYGRYVDRKDVQLPPLKEGDSLKNHKIEMHEDLTKPPKRYTPASIIKELEKRNLGTKCLTADMLVKIKSDTLQSVRISDLFKKSIKTNLMHEDAEISVNNEHECMSLRKGVMRESMFKLISRRKITPNERVLQVILNDGSIIKGTENHPIYCWNNGKFLYKPISELKVNDKLISTFTNMIDKTGKEIVIDWEEFVEKTNEKTKIYGFFDLKKYRKGSQYQLAKELGAKQPIISEWESKKRVPLWVFKKIKVRPGFLEGIVSKKIKNPFPMRLSSSLARIFANLIGDGSIDSERIKRENCYDLRYHNTNKLLIKRFIHDIFNVFGIKVKSKSKSREQRKRYYHVKIPAMCGRILYLIAPEIILKLPSRLISKEFYMEFIGALFDDEGHTVKNETKLFISNTNFEMLSKVKDFLEELNIKSTLSKRQFKLFVYGLENLALFLEKIPILSYEKKLRLFNMFTRFYKYGTKKSKLLKEKEIIIALLNKKKTSPAIAIELNIAQSLLRYYLKQLIQKGILQKETIGISKRPRKKIIYSLKKDISNTYYSFIGEKILNPFLFTKTVDIVLPIKYKGYVYDITNRSNAKNFMLDNGVIVHNSTRATIIDTLYQRQYVNAQSIEATELGIKTVETLEKYYPEILDEQLTRHFEEDTELVREDKKTKEEILKEAEAFLTKALIRFKQHEKKIGEALLQAMRITRTELSRVTQCPLCKEGDLLIRYSPRFRSYFLGCSKYPDCKNTSSLPSGLPKPSKNICKECGSPEVLIIRQGKRPFNYCINKQCKLKVEWLKQQQEKQAAKEKPIKK